MSEISVEHQIERGGNLQLSLLPVEYEELQVIRSGEKAGVFCRGFCFCTYDLSDRFSRNYCIVQLHLSGGVKLKRLSNLFGLGYQHCSNILGRYRREGIDGLVERTEVRFSNRKIIDEEVGEFILGLRESGHKYQEISKAIRFRFGKRVKEQSIRAWVCRENKQNQNPEISEEQGEFFGEEEKVSIEEEGDWRWNKYAGSLLLYGDSQGGWF